MSVTSTYNVPSNGQFKKWTCAAVATDVIPLGIRCKKDSQASNTIQIGLLQFDGLFTTAQTVYLRELLSGGGYAYYDIKTTPHQFTITADIATDETRFALVFESPTTKTIAAQQAFTARLSPNPYTDGFKITVADSLQGIVKVQLYNMLGKLMEETTINASQLGNQSFGKGLSTGVYQAVIIQGGYKQTIKAIKN